MATDDQESQTESDVERGYEERRKTERREIEERRLSDFQRADGAEPSDYPSGSGTP